MNSVGSGVAQSFITEIFVQLTPKLQKYIWVHPAYSATTNDTHLPFPLLSFSWPQMSSNPILQDLTKPTLSTARNKLPKQGKKPWA